MPSVPMSPTNWENLRAAWRSRSVFIFVHALLGCLVRGTKADFVYPHIFNEQHGVRVFYRTWSFEFYWWSSSCHVSFRRNYEKGGIAISLPPLALYISIPALSFPRSRKDYEGRVLSFGIHDWALWWNVWTPEMSWSSKTPKYRNGSFHPIDFVLGQGKFESRSVRDLGIIEIPMPEGVYDAHVTLKIEQWRRKRWFAKKPRQYFDFELGAGIPHPGKGENSWDCGMNATCGISSSAENLSLAVGDVVGRCLESRVKYGGMNSWRCQRPGTDKAFRPHKV